MKEPEQDEDAEYGGKVLEDEVPDVAEAGILPQSVVGDGPHGREDESGEEEEEGQDECNKADRAEKRRKIV